MKYDNQLTRLRRKAASEIEQIITQDSLKNNQQINVMKNSLQNLADEGRQILKYLDDYKFKLIQSINMFNDDTTKSKLEQKQKILMSAASLIYSVVFDMENMNLTPLYEEEQFSTYTDEQSKEKEDNEFDNNLEEDLSNETDTNEEESAEEDKEEDNKEDKEFEDLKLQGGFDDLTEEDLEGEDFEELDFDNLPEDLTEEEEETPKGGKK